MQSRVAVLVMFLGSMVLIVGCGDSGGGSRAQKAPPAIAAAPPGPPAGPPAAPPGPPAVPPVPPTPPGAVANTPATTPANPSTVPPGPPMVVETNPIRPSEGTSVDGPNPVRPPGSEDNGPPPGVVPPMPMPEPMPQPVPLPNDPNNPANPSGPKPPTLFEKAATQFRDGNDSGALSVLQMHYLAEDIEQIAHDVRWVPALKKPTAVVRWGIGIVYNAPRGYTGHPRPIGFDSPSTRPNIAANKGKSAAELRKERAQRQPVAAPQNAQAPADAKGILAFYTGDLGTQVFESLEKRIQDKELGAVLATALEKPMQNNGQPAPLPAIDPAQLGLVMRALSKEGKIDPKRLPPALANVDPAALAALVQKTQAGVADLKPLLPGVSLLGLGTVHDLEKKAKTLQLDVLLIYSVDVRPATAADIVNNTTRFRLTAVNSGEKLFESLPLNNIKVNEERERVNAEDPSEAELEKLWGVVDAKLKPTDLPAGLTPEVAKRRVASLAAEGLPKLMPNMIEMRLYQAKGLVTEEDLLTVAGETLGPEALLSLTKAFAGGENAGDNINDAIEKLTKKLGEDLNKEKPADVPDEK